MILQAEQTHYDVTKDIRYPVVAQGSIHRSEEVAAGITVEHGNDGAIIGIEILRASKVQTAQVVASLHAKQAGVL